MSNTNFDVAIVGAGIIGRSIALELAKHDVSIVLIDPQSSSDGQASIAAGAMIDAFGENELKKTDIELKLMQLRLDSQRIYRSWLAELADSAGKSVHHNEGMFIVANAGGDHDIEHFAQMRSLMSRYEEPWQETDPKSVPGLNPNVGFQAHAALFMPNALSVDTDSLMSTLYQALSLKSNVTIVNERVKTINRTGEDWYLECQSGDNIYCKKIVLSAGAHCNDLLAPELRENAGIPEIFYGRGISCVTTGLPEIPHAIRTPNRALACGIHLVPRSGGELYLGASNLFGMDLNLPKGPSVGELHSMLGTLCTQLNTNLRNTSVSKFHWGLRPVTADGAPVLGESLIPGLYVASGMHRVGVTLAPLVKDILCDQILELGNNLVNPFPISEKNSNKPIHDIALGMRSLLATVLYPDGHMPYNRSQELEVFLTELFSMAMEPEKSFQLREKLLSLSNKIEMDEQSMIRIFHEVLQHKLPEKGPYAI